MMKMKKLHRLCHCKYKQCILNVLKPLIILIRSELARRNIGGDYEEAFEELKRTVDIGHIMITYGLNFDDLVEQFKMERYQQISVPLHQVSLFSRSDVKGTVRGSLLARTHLPSIFSPAKARMFE